MTTDIPKMQKAAVYSERAGPIKFDEISVPEPQPDELLVKLLYSGVCHSDVHAYFGDYEHVQLKFPLVGGHEGTGHVVKVGSQVKDFNVGDAVGVKFLAACLNCEFCKRGYEPNCTNATWSGFRHDGTFQRYAVVRANAAVRIPAGVDLAQAAPILCAGWTAYTAVRAANLKTGEWCVVPGAGGGLGSMAIQYARAMGFRVIGIDVGNKEKSVRELGAEFFFDPTKEENLIQKVVETTGGGAHGVVNMATSIAAYEASLLYVRPRGTVVLVAMPPGAIKVDLFAAVMRTIIIKGSLVGTRQDMDEAIGFLERGLVKSPIEVIKMEQLRETFDRLLKGEVTGRMVIDLWK